MKMRKQVVTLVTALLATGAFAETNSIPLVIPRLIEPGVTDVTAQVAPLVCDAITVTGAKHDVRPTYHDASSIASASLRLNTVGTYTIHFEHPKGTNRPPINLVVEPSVGASLTNKFKVYHGCPTSCTNRQNDVLVLEWRGYPGGRGPSSAGWFFKGIKKRK
jgi:hypothetical protein